MNTMRAREFVLSITERLNRSPEAVEPLIKKLEDNWFDTVDSLKKLTDKDWESYSIPHRLLLEIKKALHDLPLKLEEIGSSPRKEAQNLVPEGSEKGGLLEDLQYGALSNEDVKEMTETWDSIIERIREEIQFTSSIADTLSLLNKIVKNIIANPTEPKKRQLKLYNSIISKKIGQYSSALRFLTKVFVLVYK